MADTAHKTKAAAKEYFDPVEVREAKVRLLAKWIRESNHMTCFTGAGISTSCGIPDFRSGMDTVLETGPGVWELRAKKKMRSRRAKTTSTLKAIPSFTHMALCALERDGILKAIISGNTDGLHRRSGFPPERLYEVHGNSNLETCKTCGHQYLRDFKCRNARGTKKHETGRLCEMVGDDGKVCGGKLRDTIINFGENLPERELTMGFAHTAESDVCLALGSSLTVTPSADMPEQVGDKKSGKLVIVNLQKTPLDRKASLVIHAKCDDVMRQLATELAMDVPEFRLRRYVKISRGKAPRKSDMRVHVQGVDRDGTPFSLFQGVTFTSDSKSGEDACAKEPFRGTLPANSRNPQVRLKFAGHYREPTLAVPVPEAETTYCCTFNPRTGVWESVEPVEAAGEARPEAGGAGGAGGAGVEEVTRGMESLGS
mmetsp:Transcript_25748/g.60743  ORF Transcript_25748/g.60743 Transcript_25748/m.60743 type:complete len:427 (+) Transcript_25748:97-1377(+)